MSQIPAEAAELRHDWSREEVLALYALPFNDLIYRAQSVHRRHFDANTVQLSTLLNIKSGGCAEDCKYCSQSARYDTGLVASKLMAVEQVREAAAAARSAGATRFCMGAAWRELKDRDLDKLTAIVREVKALGLETCMTLGMLSEAQVQALAEAGLDYYNHNIDTSPEYYPQVISTRSFQDRLDTLERVREAGINVCSGGIIGMGEAREDRAAMLRVLANLPKHPGSVPINMLVPIPGTPMGDLPPIDSFELIRTIAVARILMPRSYVRLSAGRRSLSDEAQALCFLAGANSIFYGDRLLTTGNPDVARDQALFERLGLRAEGAVAEDEAPARACCATL
ncbi:MAG TPA: biotin synthase BioB [Candidatus Competibacteraceae bacterium]|nr:biotin synthase BioB [Candidatus Competibacteraceae bacterium]